MTLSSMILLVVYRTSIQREGRISDEREGRKEGTVELTLREKVGIPRAVFAEIQHVVS